MLTVRGAHFFVAHSFVANFCQVHFCQILFKLVFISHCYHESPRGEFFFETQCTLKPYAQRTIQLDETQMQKSSQLSFQESDVIYSKPGVDPLETYATHNIVFMTVSQSVSQSINQIHTA